VLLLPLYVAYAATLSIALGIAGHRSRGTDGTAAGSSAGTDPSRPRPRRILVVGATGGTGRQLVAQALARGYEVTALVRDPSRLPLADPRLTLAVGDVLDEGSVARAMRGAEAVLSALGHRRFFGPSRILSRGTGNILRAMEAQGAARLICETSLGLGDSAGRMGLLFTFFVIPVVLPFYFWDKARQERIVAGSRAEWVIVRPAILTNGAAEGRTRHGRGVGGFLLSPRISRADVAGFMLDQLETDRYLRAAPGICS